jgi:hypothetical protein
LPIGAADGLGDLEQAEWRRFSFFDGERQLVRDRAIEIGTRYGKRWRAHRGGGESHLDLTARCRLAAEGVSNSSLGQDRREPFFSSGRRYQQEALCHGAIDGGRDNGLRAPLVPWRTINPFRPRLANDRIHFGSLVLGTPVAHRD